jgi:hypothetical protein
MRAQLIALVAGTVAVATLACFVKTGLAQQPGGVMTGSPGVSGLSQPLAANVQLQAQQEALNGLQRFADVVSANPDGKLGFKSVDELRTATAGVPMQIAFVGLQPLVSYDATKQAASMIQPATGLVVPMSVAGQVRAAIFLQANGAGFSVVGFGRPSTTAAIMSTATTVSTSQSIPFQSLTILRVPALYQTFIARSATSGIMLTPITDAPAFGLQRGTELPVEDAFQRLKPAATAYRPSTLGVH